MLQKFLFGGDITVSRISRQTWWISFLCVIVFSFLIRSSLSSLFQKSFEPIILIISTTVVIFFSVKRLHDIKKSSWFVLLYIPQQLVAISFPILSPYSTNIFSTFLVGIVSTLTSVLSLILIIMCGFQIGTNTGPDPLNPDKETEENKKSNLKEELFFDKYITYFTVFFIFFSAVSSPIFSVVAPVVFLLLAIYNFHGKRKEILKGLFYSLLLCVVLFGIWALLFYLFGFM